jgi:hypothetical protein
MELATYAERKTDSKFFFRPIECNNILSPWTPYYGEFYTRIDYSGIILVATPALLLANFSVMKSTV